MPGVPSRHWAMPARNAAIISSVKRLDYGPPVSSCTRLSRRLRMAEPGRPPGSGGALDQITAEGVSQQHSFNYHRMVLQLLLWMVQLSRIHNAPLDAGLLTSSTPLSISLAPGSTRSPVMRPTTSDDDALLFPLSLSNYEDYRPGARKLPSETRSGEAGAKQLCGFAANLDRSHRHTRLFRRGRIPSSR